VPSKMRQLVREKEVQDLRTSKRTESRNRNLGDDIGLFGWLYEGSDNFSTTGG